MAQSQKGNGDRKSGDRVPRVPLERAMSKLGLASRSQARVMIHEGRVRVNGKVITDVRVLVVPEWARIEIDDEVKADKRDQRDRKR